MDETQFNVVIQDIREGSTLVAALKRHEIPVSTFYAFRAKDPLRAEVLARARRDMTHALVDQAIDIVDSEPDHQRGRVRAEVRLKVARALNPKEFSERIDLTVVDATNPAALHAEGQRRVRLMRDQAHRLVDQGIEDAQIIEHGAPGGQSVPALSAPSIFD